MTEPAPTSAKTTSSRKWPLITAAMVVVALLAGAGWYFFLRDDSPGEFDIESAAEGAGDTEDDTGGDAGDDAGDDTTSSTGDDTVEPGSGFDGDVEGTWTIDPDAGDGGSEAGFRVDEELASVGASTAVGRTPGVDGSLTIEGTTVTAVEITGDLTQLESNDTRRDDRMHGALATDEFPTATFTLTEPIELGSVPAEGETISVTAVGEMTIKGVTNEVEVTLDARLVDGVLVVVGSTPVVFENYDVEKPTAPIVVSIEDQGTIEFQLYFTQT